MTQTNKMRCFKAARAWTAALALCCLAPPGIAQTTQITREVQYGYNATTGLLEWERVDPNQPHCSETIYEHDAYGNRRKVRVKPCTLGASNVATAAEASFTERVTDNSFDAVTTGTASQRYPAGAYLTRSVARRSDTTVGQQAESVFDPRFGAAITTTEVAPQDATRSVSKRAEYDALGRLLKEYVPVHRDGAGTVYNIIQYRWYYCGTVAQIDGAAGTACIDTQSASVPISYASGMLVNDAGNVVSSAVLSLRSAYYMETTPFAADGTTLIGARTRTHFDSLHREFAKETEAYSGHWTASVKAFDALGMEAAAWVPYTARSSANGTFAAPETSTSGTERRQWTAVRDLLHRPTRQTRSHRATSTAALVQLTTQLSYAGLVSSVTLPGNGSPDTTARTTSVRKNAIGKVVQTIDAYGATLSSAYDPVGNLVRTVDALSNTTTIEYTAVTARFKTRLTDPNQGAWNYSYDALGQLKTQTDAKGQVTTLAYDEFGRLTAKTNPSQNGFWYHDKNAAGGWCAAGLSRICETRAGQPPPSNAVIVSETITYDTLNRPQQTTTSQGDRTFTSSVGYDPATGRVVRQTYPTGFAVGYTYSAAGSGRTPGVLERVYNFATPGDTFWSIQGIDPTTVFDARGNLMRSNLGNNLGTNHAFDPLSGKAFDMRAGVAAGYTNALSLRYEYDLADNLKLRQDVVKAITETYTYDRLNRLTQHTASSGEATANRTVSLGYNAIGNVISKSDVGGYGYQPGRPHAVASANGLNYTYDTNGSLLEVRAPGTSGTDGRVRQVEWTAFNQPSLTSYMGKTVAFTHDQDHQRIREVITDGAKVRTLDLVHPDNKGGLAYEREETRVNNTVTQIENRHYVSVGGTVVAVVKTNNDTAVIANASRIQYWHKDALGSVVAISDGTGQVVEQMAYDAWGRRVRTNGMADYAVDPTNGDRGFTGHEHLDEVQLVHMNGRVYDPLLGKFLSVDPVVGDPNDLQTYNRYSYVYNQPTRYADATGECPWCLVFIAGALMAHEGNKHWAVVGSILMIASAPPIVAEAGLGAVGTFANSAASAGLAAAASPGATPESVMTAVVFAPAFTGAGRLIGTAQQVLAHMVLGCAQQAVSGGNCGPGALAAGFAKVASGALPPGMDSVPRGILVALIGGTASVMGGGKFGNGAVQATFGYVFNELTSNDIGKFFHETAEREWLRGLPGELRDGAMIRRELTVMVGDDTGRIDSALINDRIKYIEHLECKCNPGADWTDFQKKHADALNSGNFRVIGHPGIDPNKTLNEQGWAAQRRLYFNHTARRVMQGKTYQRMKATGNLLVDFIFFVVP